jgi:Na+-translocating ferredoxin:NAD+ oxidoreductase RNF subunit RnfB
MSVRKIYVPFEATKFIEFNPKVCNGCPTLEEPRCVKACRMDMLVKNPEPGKPPLTIYSDECCDCGCCVHACPRALQGAIKMNYPIAENVRWKEKKTGKHFRIGMPNPPSPNTKPPSGGWYPENKET